MTFSFPEYTLSFQYPNIYLYLYIYICICIYIYLSKCQVLPWKRRETHQSENGTE